MSFFIRGGFWLMTHCSDPYPRVRMLAASTTDWKKHKSNPETTPFCRGYITSHIQADNAVVPRARLLFCRRQTEHDIKMDGVEERVKFLPREELEQEISATRVEELNMG